MSSNKSSKAGRLVLGAALLIALAAVIFAGEAQPALAQVDIQASLLLNSSFETDSNNDGVPNSWDLGGSSAPGDKRVCSQSHAGSCSFKMVADTGGKWLNQCFTPSSPSISDDYKLKVFVKTKNLVNGSGDVRLYLDYTVSGSAVDSLNTIIPVGTNDFTLFQISNSASLAYEEICIYLQSENAQSGKVWFDKVTLVKLP